METENNLDPKPDSFLSNFGDIPNMPSFLSEQELKSIMMQYAPLAMKDISAIEKGSENFFRFNESINALTKLDFLSVLQIKDLKYLELRKSLFLIQFIEFVEEMNVLRLRMVAIRPPSLRTDHGVIIKRACITGSAISVLRYINFRDKVTKGLTGQGELKNWIANNIETKDSEGKLINTLNQTSLPQILKNLRSLSFEYFLSKKINADDALITSVIYLLSRKPGEIVNLILGSPSCTDDARAVFHARGSMPILLRLTPDFHIIQPMLGDLIDIAGGGIAPLRNEAEAHLEIFSDLGEKILRSLLPSDAVPVFPPDPVKKGKIIIEELEKHPSFTENMFWEEAPMFIASLNSLIRTAEWTEEARKEFLVEYIMNENLKKGNGNFDGFTLSPANLEVSQHFLNTYFQNEPNLLFSLLEGKIKANKNILYKDVKLQSSESSGIFILFRENFPQSFIQNPKKRTSLNTLARENGYLRGVYDFLRSVKQGVDPEFIVKEQIQYSKAIKDWENELAEQKRRQEKKNRSILTILIDLLTAILSIFIKDKKNTESGEGQYKPTSREPKAERPGVIHAPHHGKERKAIIPLKLMKAIETAELKSGGLIWVDEVFDYLSSPNYSKIEIADMLYYDQNKRFSEIKALNAIRHVFIRRELEKDMEWLKRTVTYLDNLLPRKPEYIALSEYLKKLL